MAYCLLQKGSSPLYIEGYTLQLSYLPGDQIEFHISTSASQYSLEIARVGADYEVVWQEKNILGIAYPIPEDAFAQGGHSPVGFTLRIPDAPGKADTMWLRCE